MVATDDDTTLAYNTVRYWLKDNYNSTFRIDTNTGDIYLEKSVNYDLPDNQTSFDLQVDRYTYRFYSYRHFRILKNNCSQSSFLLKHDYHKKYYYSNFVKCRILPRH